jgi:hypothetical protein
MKIQHFLILLIQLLAIETAFAFQWTLYEDIVKERKISDDKESISVGDWICTAGAVDRDVKNNERRSIGCGIGKGPQVSVAATCTFDAKKGRPWSEGGVLEIEIKGTKKQIAVGCGP